jgi:hypothetical protein
MGLSLQAALERVEYHIGRSTTPQCVFVTRGPIGPVLRIVSASDSWAKEILEKHPDQVVGVYQKSGCKWRDVVEDLRHFFSPVARSPQAKTDALPEAVEYVDFEARA